MSQEVPSQKGKACLTAYAKVQLVNTLTSWSNKRREELAKMELDPKVDRTWLEEHKKVLKETEDSIAEILELSECQASS